MGTLPMYELKGIPDDECTSIFVRCAFKEGEAEQYTNLLEIGKAIVKKCNGLPLAVKSLGSLLFTKREKCEWVRIRDMGIWEIAQKENDTLPILKLSYDEMPQHLKQCFAICALYPKDFIFTRLDIITQWMAQGFICIHYESMKLEDIGDQYLHELISLSFFQDVVQIYDDSIDTLKMQDLVHDLALSVAGKTISHIKLDSARNFSEKTRHILVCEDVLEGKDLPSFLLKLNKLRTLQFAFATLSISKQILDTVIKTFTCLRLLDLGTSDLEELPSSIGTLRNLRCLYLSKNINLKKLPSSICNLINLQNLHLLGCIMLQDLPREFGNLCSLRFLSVTCQMKCFPVKGLAEGLSSLQELWLFQCVNLEILSEGTRYLIALRQLYISECPNLISLPAQGMRYLNKLEHLAISRCDKLNFSDEDSKTIELPGRLLYLCLALLPKLKELPSGFQGVSPSIKYLSIAACNSFKILPEWLQKCTSLSTLKLVNCSTNMKENCQAETGKYFPFISQIPQIHFA